MTEKADELEFNDQFALDIELSNTSLRLICLKCRWGYSLPVYPSFDSVIMHATHHFQYCKLERKTP